MPEARPDLDVVTQLADGRVTHLLVDHQLRKQEIAERLTVFPGAFNPLHAGHYRIAVLAAERLQRRVAFELSVENVDKPQLTPMEVRRRVQQFSPTDLVCLTRAATFEKKAPLFRDACFLLGADTIERVANARYYGDQPAQRDRAIAKIAECGCSFLVFGRLIRGEFRTLDDLALPAALREICAGLDEEEFRVDVSSTALRSSLPRGSGK